jgi:predicted GIY-YIG superfamily endonuclease
MHTLIEWDNMPNAVQRDGIIKKQKRRTKFEILEVGVASTVQV